MYNDTVKWKLILQINWIWIGQKHLMVFVRNNIESCHQRRVDLIDTITTTVLSYIEKQQKVLSPSNFQCRGKYYLLFNLLVGPHHVT